MSTKEYFPSKHFDLQELTEGVFAAIHKPRGSAYSNAGIIDLGDQTLVIDAFDSVLAASDLRKAAETLLERRIHSLILTHVHSDHWFGATAFDSSTTFFASPQTAQEYPEWSQSLIEDFKDKEQLEEWIKTTEEQLMTEQDERVKVGLQTSLERVRHTLSEIEGYQPRYPDRILREPLRMKGSKRSVEIRSFGGGHSEDDVVVLVPEDKLAFIGDIGFFNTQPFMGFCDLDKWREQLRSFHDSEFEVFIPGHGTVGTKEDLARQLDYFNVMEDLVERVVLENGSLKEAKQVVLPKPFDRWLVGGMARFEVNVEYLYKRFAGNGEEDEN
jgi:cyclase